MSPGLLNRVLTGAVLDRALRKTRGHHQADPQNDVRNRRVSAKVDRLLRSAGYHVTEVNVPPPGWSVESDRREELLALGEITANRKVSHAD